MRRLILILLLFLPFFALAACGEDKEGGELCSSDGDCESGRCGYGACPASGPPCPEGEECLCLVCL
jgi:hypothetical protein